MANLEHFELLTQKLDRWNRWRKDHPEVIPDLLKADLHRADLGGADLRGADLREADLTRAYLFGANVGVANLSEARLLGANLSGAHLVGANLVEADLPWADLRRADLRGADLRGANLHGADLREADLGRAILNSANFTEVRVGVTHFAAVDLSTTNGLETVFHEGPSTIGIDTIYQSRGKIPELFLRGCGVPDQFIAYVGSLVGRPIEFYSCFISYSTDDREFAQRLHTDLQGKGVRCWFAPHEMKGGRKLHEQIDEAIRLHDRLLLILSKDSEGPDSERRVGSMSSEWVKVEIRKARQREIKEGKRVLFPIRLVSYEALRDWNCLDDTGKNIADEIREYFIPDFSNWKEHDSYQTAFQRLVKDLKAESVAG